MRAFVLSLPIVIAFAAPALAFKDCADCPEMVSVPAGAFKMGSAAAALQVDWVEPARVTVEQPQVDVTFKRGFAMGATEVTKAEYAVFAAATKRAAAPCFTYDFAAGKWIDDGATWETPGFDQPDDHPVVCVNWNDAVAYTKWLSDRTGKNYRLPSEAEFEYAARAGTTTLFPWGDDKNAACTHANVADASGLAAEVASSQAGAFNCDDGHVQTAPATFGTANGFGLTGLIGNAGEWQADCFYPDHRGALKTGAVRDKKDCTARVMRGGSWFNPPMYNRPAFRYGTGPDEAYNLVGFRVVRGD